MINRLKFILIPLILFVAFFGAITVEKYRVDRWYAEHQHKTIEYCYLMETYRGDYEACRGNQIDAAIAVLGMYDTDERESSDFDVRGSLRKNHVQPSYRTPLQPNLRNMNVSGKTGAIHAASQEVVQPMPEVLARFVRHLTKDQAIVVYQWLDTEKYAEMALYEAVVARCKEVTGKE